MKILFISENYPPYIEGGAEISTSLLASWLAKNHIVSVACSRFVQKPWIEEGVMVYPLILKTSLDAKNVLSALKYAAGIIMMPIISSVRILRLIKKIDPDVINIVVTLYSFIPIILAIKLFSHRPIFIDCRDYSLICPLQFKNNEIQDPKQSHHGYYCFLNGYQINSKFLRFFMTPFALYESCVFNFYKSSLRHTINSYEGITLVPLSHYVQQQLILNGFHENKTLVIPNISRRMNKANHIEKAIIPTFAYGGRIEEEKGIWDLVVAVELLQKDAGRPFLVKIAGMGSAYDSLRNYLEKNKSLPIVLLGQIQPNKVLALYQESLAILAPSRWPEPFGRFIQESISVGTPVIATATGGVTEGIQDKLTGLLIKVGDPQQLAAAMKYLIENPAQGRKMGIAMMEQRVKYEAEYIGKKRLELYQDLNYHF